MMRKVRYLDEKSFSKWGGIDDDYDYNRQPVKHAKFHIEQDTMLKNSSSTRNEDWEEVIAKCHKYFRKDVQKIIAALPYRDQERDGLKLWTPKERTVLTKLPILYQDLMKNGRFRKHLIFRPGQPFADGKCGGSGKILLTGVFAPDTLFDVVYYDLTNTPIDELDRLIDWREEREQPGEHKYVDVYYLKYKNLPYATTIEFIKDEKYEPNRYNGSWFDELIRQHDVLFNNIVDLIADAKLDSHEDYMSLLRDIVVLDYDFDSPNTL